MPQDQRPILILQLQRMGDLVLTFPLMLWLSRMHPGRPLWVVAEEGFYSQLMAIGPRAVYFPWLAAAHRRLKKEHFHLVLNLSHRREAAALAGEVEAETKLGPVMEEGSVYVHGPWQLYRSSLTLNNRHNRFHWADLNALDATPIKDMAQTAWPEPRDMSSKVDKVGLFLGASSPSKRPQPYFWGNLGAALLARGLQPVLLGGPAEVDLGREVARRIPGRVLNMCGKLELSNFAAMGQTLNCMVTPDTGPMHLAAWTGLKTLNLSMGPVNCWETGPYQPGHYVLKAETSCAGCWECTRASQLCAARFKGRKLALLVDCVANSRLMDLPRLRLPGLGLYRTARKDGLYSLTAVNAPRKTGARENLGEFWRLYFGAAHGLWDVERATGVLAVLAGENPGLHQIMGRSLAALGRDLGAALKTKKPLSESFWGGGRPALRPLRSLLQMILENGDYSARAWSRAMDHLERLTTIWS